MNKLSEILTENTQTNETSFLLGDSYSEVSEVLDEIVSTVVQAQDVSSDIVVLVQALDVSATAVLQVQDVSATAVLQVQDVSATAVLQVQDVSSDNIKLSWQPYIDALQQNISSQSELNSNEVVFIQTICNDPSAVFLREIKTYVSAISIKESVNMMEITKLIMFIHKKIKEITGLQIDNIRILIVLEYFITSFLNSNLLIVENKEDVKKHVKEVLELLTVTVPTVKTGCMGVGCILC